MEQMNQVEFPGFSGFPGFSPFSPPLHRPPEATVDHLQCIELADQFVDGSHGIVFS